MPTFDEVVRDAETAPITGWDFSWLAGRATEERPSWGYTKLLVPRVERVQSLLDVQTGGGEVLAEVLDRSTQVPARIAATESWAPNAALARAHLAEYDGDIAEIADDAEFPFSDTSFELVVSRHPVSTRWDEIARVLSAGGSYFAQHVGPGSNRELTDFLMGPQPVSKKRSPERAVADATAEGLELVDLRKATLRVEFFDVGGVIYFLRKVRWTVPGFTVEKYREQLARLHDQITAEGSFVSHARRFLVEFRSK